MESANKLELSNNFVFQHDKNPKYRAAFANDWFKKKTIEVLKWSPFSPDLNPLKTYGTHQKEERRMKKHQPKNKDELKWYLLHGWIGIDADITEKLVDSVPNRLYNCSKMKGYPTRYQLL